MNFSGCRKRKTRSRIIESGNTTYLMYKRNRLTELNHVDYAISANHHRLFTPKIRRPPKDLEQVIRLYLLPVHVRGEFLQDVVISKASRDKDKSFKHTAKSMLITASLRRARCESGPLPSLRNELFRFVTLAFKAPNACRDSTRSCMNTHAASSMASVGACHTLSAGQPSLAHWARYACSPLSSAFAIDMLAKRMFDYRDLLQWCCYDWEQRYAGCEDFVDRTEDEKMTSREAGREGTGCLLPYLV